MNINGIINDVIISQLFEGVIDKNIKLYERLIIDSVIEYMKSKFDFDVDISVKKMKSKTLIGDITLNSKAVNNHKFILTYDSNQGFDMIIKSLIHELTHIKQVVNGELKPSTDYSKIIWKNDFTLSVDDYNRINDINEHKKLPWEMEAYDNMMLIDDYKKSEYWSNLKGKDPTLDYIISN